MQRVVGLQLENFRSYKQYVLHLDPQVTILSGPNASGKTTLIEALYLGATGESFRATKVEEMVKFEAEFGRVQIKLRKDQEIEINAEDETQANGEDVDLEITVTRGVVQGKATSKRLYGVNGIRRRRAGLIGNFYAVVFRPEDMRLIEGSTARRRDFLDRTLSMLFPTYEQSHKNYGQALVRYNKLLQAVRDGEQPFSVLKYWEQLLIQHGQILQKHRTDFIAAINEVAFVMKLSCLYKASLITSARIDEYRPRALAAGHTLIGPHKDDIAVYFVPSSLPRDSEEKDMALFGSRGQQRLAVLWLKLSELAYIKQTKGQSPLLLLDDIFSELDEDNAQIIINLIQQHQSVISSAHPQAIPVFFTSVATTEIILAV